MARISSSSSSGTVNVIRPGIAAIVYDEATNVPVGVETTIVIYTLLGTSGLLSNIGASGQNIGEIRIYINGSIIDKQYLYYTDYNLNFAFEGISLNTGDVVAVKVLNSGQETCNFNANIQVTEVQ